MDVKVGSRVLVECRRFGLFFRLSGEVIEVGGMGRFVVRADGSAADFRVKPSKRHPGKFDVIAKRRQVFRGADVEVV